MSNNLVVVESPAKAETIKKYLGQGYEVLASYGHVRDLPSKGGSAVDPTSNFDMTYAVSEKSLKHVDAISRAMKKASSLYLATDLDREGEAISWHLVEILKTEGKLDGKTVHRVVFNEITETAIKQAMSSPREVSMDLVNAQQARRALDYLVGFNLSPLLWKKIKPGLSAGRVQSPALRLICEREYEIEKFVPKEYWTIESSLKKDSISFEVKLDKIKGKKLSKFSITSKTDAEKIKTALVADSEGRMIALKVEKKDRKRNPTPPFITSTLQQEAVRKLGFTAQRTMRVAQQLYEGIEISEQSVGLITYMRTDSVTLSEDSLKELRSFIFDAYGDENLPKETRTFKTNAKNAQEAHEAIRPTSFNRKPDDVKPFLSEEQNKLYDLIWKRSVASQMESATIESISVDFNCGNVGVFRGNGSRIKKSGFLAVYSEEDGVTSEKFLPKIDVGEELAYVDIKTTQHFTEPPPRFNEASLVKTLEEYGIGRPSTYASIISTLIQREYVELESKRFSPTDIGRLVSGFLTSHFSGYVDYEFTAQLEDGLDAVSRGEVDWVTLLSDFWQPFEETVKTKESVSRKEVLQERRLGNHPKSGKPVSVRMGRYGPYVIIGDVEDEEKPSFYGLAPGQKMSELTLESALELTKLPRALGKDNKGTEYSVNRGRFGPYVMYVEPGKEDLMAKKSKKAVKPKGKYAALGKDDDPHTISLDRAIELVDEKKLADAAKKIMIYEEHGIEVLNGRFGPYITDGQKNAKVPKDLTPSELSLEQCRQILEAAPAKRSRKKKVKRA